MIGTRDPGPGSREEAAAYWRPSASLETLASRANLLRKIREFFHARGVLEVDAPVLSQYATVDRHIESFRVIPSPESRVPSPGFLATSPEFGMKRLLAAGSGPIYQLNHVFRAEEAGRWHNPEFMMLEWYRPGWNHHRLMDEVEELMRELVPGLPPFARQSYAQVFREQAQLNPHRDPVSRLRAAALAVGLGSESETSDDRDFWLDLWMAGRIGECLGLDRPLFVYDFPASQAALARIRDGDPPLAERFELFWKGQELANGFHELADAAEQRRRFEADRAWREAHKRPAPPYDIHLVAALESGIPDCAGVALGVDRLLALKLGLPGIAAAMPFSYDGA